MDDAAVMAAQAQVEGLLGEARAALEEDAGPRLVWEVLGRAIEAVVDGLARKLTAIRPVVDAEAYAVLDHIEKLADRALSSDRSDFKFYLDGHEGEDAIRKEVEALNARGMQPEGAPQAREQAREVLRLAEIFSAGCGNTAPLGEPPEECPGCAADFVARVRKAAEAAWERERPETREEVLERFAPVAAAENTILRDLPMVPGGEPNYVPRTPLPEISWKPAEPSLTPTQKEHLQTERPRNLPEIDQLRRIVRCTVRNLCHADDTTPRTEPGPICGPVWAKVAHVCGLGSTSAIALCREMGVDPDFDCSRTEEEA